tara:strand:+ start:2175 stop:2939 length:765 start_codon:yes stop_codon:yes gene_type:complete
MKIGLLCNFYGFPEYTDRCLKPWLNIKEVEKVAVSSYQYSDYVKCGWDFDDTETPKQLLEDYRGFVNYICIGKDGDDSFSRNAPLQHLTAHDLDYVWLLDQDEFYSEEQIKNTINYIKNSKDSCTYRINFKNFVFTESQYVEDFIAPRIFSVKINGQKSLSHFYYENDVAYNINNEMIDYKNLSMSDIPQEECYPDHYSWVGSPEFLKAKVKYQLKRYNGICSYKWDEEKNSLSFNEDFYSRFKLEKPEVKHIV